MSPDQIRQPAALGAAFRLTKIRPSRPEGLSTGASVPLESAILLGAVTIAHLLGGSVV
jgi:hypothetical protein